MGTDHSLKRGRETVDTSGTMSMGTLLSSDGDDNTGCVSDGDVRAKQRPKLAT